MALQCLIKAKQREIDEFKSGERYRKLQTDYRRVTEGYIKEVKKLRNELADAHAHGISVRNMWADDCEEIWREHVSEMAKKDETILKLKDELCWTKWDNEDNLRKLKQDYEEQLYEKDCIIDELKKELAHDKALLGRDGTKGKMK